MDDYTLPSLTQSKNLWCMTLLNMLTPSISHGFRSICEESQRVCRDSNDNDKYLLTLQTFLSRIPKWNQNIIDNEVSRIIENSKCSYIDELITCVHIVHLKALTCIRAGKRQKEIDIDIPNLSQFIHKTYIKCARKLYNNVYLYEDDIPPLEIQRNCSEIDMIIRTAILETINDSIPIESILRAYLEKDEEEEVLPDDTELYEDELKGVVQKEERPDDMVQNVERPNDDSSDKVRHTTMNTDNKDNYTTDEATSQRFVISDTSIAQKTDGTIYSVNTELRDGSQIELENGSSYKSDDDVGGLVIGNVLPTDGIECIPGSDEIPPDLGTVVVLDN